MSSMNLNAQGEDILSVTGGGVDERSSYPLVRGNIVQDLDRISSRRIDVWVVDDLNRSYYIPWIGRPNRSHLYGLETERFGQEGVQLMNSLKHLGDFQTRGFSESGITGTDFGSLRTLYSQRRMTRP